jgi:Flp pilus assembly pilin Flp
MRADLEQLLSRVAAWAARDDGQGLTEYALVLVLVALVAIVALTVIGGDATSQLTTVARPL